MALCSYDRVFSETSQEDSAFDNIISGDSKRVAKGLDFISANRPANFIPKLREILSAKDKKGLHKAAKEALGKYPASLTLDAWISILNDTPSFLVKKDAIAFLAGQGSREIVPPLMEQIKSPFHTLRNAAILSLKKFRDDRVYAYILNLAASEDPVYKVYSLEAIYHLYDSRLYNFLIDQLKDDNKSIRYYALLCLEKNEFAKSINHIHRLALNDKSTEVRVKAIEILGSGKAGNPLPVFLQCVADEQRDIRFATVRAIQKKKYSTTSNLLSNQLFRETEEDIKVLLMDTLIDFKDGGGYKGLSNVLLKDSNPALRTQAAYSIGAIKNLQGLPYLISALKDGDPRVKAEVCGSLRYFKENRVLQSLMEVIHDDTDLYVRTAALYSLKTIKMRNSLLPLFNAFTEEKDGIFRELLRLTVAEMITQFI